MTTKTTSTNTVTTTATTGTCQICGRQIKLVNGKIARHGWKEPRFSLWQTASCSGTKQLPYEVSRDFLPVVIKTVEANIVKHTTAFQEFVANPPAVLRHRRTDAYGRTISLKEIAKPEDFDPKTPVWAGRWSYSELYKDEIHTFEKCIEQAKDRVEYLQERFNNWKKA